MKTKSVIIVVMLIFAVTFNCFAAELNSEYEKISGFGKIQGESEDVVIALIDTGINTDRLDKDKISEGKNYVSDADKDLVGHGTKIASLIIGADDGEDSISALAPNALIVPLTYYSKYLSGVPINGGIEAICKGIYDAVNTYNAKVIVISSGVKEDNEKLKEAILYAEDSNVIVISAAGNDGDNTYSYPAAYPTVISVGSIDSNKEITDFSQKSGGITVVAPGENLYGVSIKNGSYFEQCSGTSYSCAYVAAMAARLLGVYQDMTPQNFRWVLQNTSTDILKTGYDEVSGFGIINSDKTIYEYEDIIKKTYLPFYDVVITDRFYNSVCKAYEKGLMNGVESTKFEPNGNITRGMFITILYRLCGEIINAKSEFTDVLQDAYYSEAVAWATKNNIVYGISKTEFAPDNYITYEQMLLITDRYVKAKDSDTSIGSTEYENLKGNVTRAEAAEMLMILSEQT